MSIWYRVSAVCVLLIVFQIFLPVKGISFLSIVDAEFGSRISEVVDEVGRNPKSEIYFFGDMMLARDVERTMRRSGADFPFAGFSIPSTSYAVVNFESAIPAVHVPTQNNTFRFSTPVSSLDAVKAAGFTHLGLANNHTFDFGLAGYNHTVSKIWDSGLTPFGHPSVVTAPSYTVIEASDETVGIIALHTLYSTPTYESLAEVMEIMKTESTLQIAYVHWGEEYTHYPSAQQRKFAQLLADLGVDIIIGHHPHVVQGIEMINDTLVFYSLGNFIFDQYFSLAVQQGLVVKLALGNENFIEIQPVSSLETRNQPTEMSAENKALFLKFLADISTESMRTSILEGTISLDSLLASSREVVIMAE